MSVDDTIKILQNEGYKMTHRRKEIIYYSFYRKLHLFNDLNILESTSLNAEKHFRLNCSNDHHHHFICNICGKTKTLDICPMNDIGNMLAGYTIEGHKFEVYGTCPNC